jgi:hypothetical protein
MSKRYELSIKASYVPGWDTYAGVREIIQNARDAEIQFDAPMKVEFMKRRRNGEEVGALVVTNTGCTMPLKVLLMGHTTKLDDSRLIGKYGEGLNVGVLALLRLGVEVLIRNGSEVWRPSIAWSNNFDADILVFDVSSGHKENNRVQVEVVGITEPQWEEIKSKLLFLGKMPERIECPSGEVLTDPRYRGQLFVKGMFVGKRQETFGFNFKDADIDRDRRMISDVDEKITGLLAESMNRGHLVTAVYEMLREGNHDFYGLNYRLNEEASEAIAKEFLSANPGAIPVASEDEAKELEHLGSKGVLVPYSLRTIVQKKTGSAAEKLKNLRRSAKHEYSMNDLTVPEAESLQMAIGLVARAQRKLGEVKPLSRVIMVDFSDEKLMGTYGTDSGVVRMARKILTDRAKTVTVLIHEVAHKHGLDGKKTHTDAIHELTEKILEELLQ